MNWQLLTHYNLVSGDDFAALIFILLDNDNKPVAPLTLQ